MSGMENIVDKRSAPDWDMNGERPFFDRDEQILVHSLGSWEEDLAEAERRMKQMLLGMPVINTIKMNQFKVNRFAWKQFRTYRRMLWLEEYYHSHDGEEVRGEMIYIRRITRADFYNNMGNYGGTGREIWKYAPELMADEQERYILPSNETKIKKLRVHNFLGMNGFFEAEYVIWW